MQTLKGPKEKFNLLKVPKYAIHNTLASRDLERQSILVKVLTKGIVNSLN